MNCVHLLVGLMAHDLYRTCSALVRLDGMKQECKKERAQNFHTHLSRQRITSFQNLKSVTASRGPQQACIVFFMVFELFCEQAYPLS